MRFIKSKLSKISLIVIAAMSVFPKLQAEDTEPEISNPTHLSYLAHVAAANASMRLNEPNEARRWVSSAPIEWRGWEYDYLESSLDNSLGVFDSLNVRPLSQDYSSDGKLLAVACEDSAIRIYDIETRTIIKELRGHNDIVYSAKFFPDNQRILSCSRDSTLRIWNLNGDLIAEANAGGQGLQSADINPAGDKIAYCSWQRGEKGVVGIVSLWDANTLEKIWETDFDVKPIVIIKFSPDGSHFAVGTWNWKVAVWNTANPGEPKVFNLDDVLSYSAIDDIAFSPDGTKIAAATKNGTPRVWSLETGKKLLDLHGHKQPVMSIAFSIDGSQIYTGGNDASIAIWDAATGIRLARLFGHGDVVNSIEFRPVGSISAASQALGARQLTTISTDKTIRIWDAGTGLEFQNPAGRAPHSYGFSLSNDGNLLATGGKDGSVSVWNAHTGELVRNFAALGNIINAADFNPDGKQIVVCNWNNTLKVLNAETGQEVHVLETMTAGSPSCVFSPDGKYFAAGSGDRNAYVWNSKNGKIVRKLEHAASLTYVAFSPDSRYFVCAVGDGEVAIWSTKDWTKVQSLPEQGIIHCLDFSPDGKEVVTAGRNNQARIWDIETGQPKLALNENDNLIWSIVYSPKGDRIATGSADNSIRLWDAQTGVGTLIISDLSDPVYNLAFSPDGTRLYANSSGAELKVYDTVPIRERIQALTQTSSK